MSVLLLFSSSPIPKVLPGSEGPPFVNFKINGLTIILPRYRGGWVDRRIIFISNVRVQLDASYDNLGIRVGRVEFALSASVVSYSTR